MTDPIYFCVDAGGTRSRGRLYALSGAILAEAVDGQGNASTRFDDAVANITNLWRRLNAAIGRDPLALSNTVFSIGGAGLYDLKARDPFIARCPAFATVFAMSDGYAALIGAGNGRPCALLTVGTGTAGHRLYDDGTSIQRDGWGWLVGDRGSGCWMGTLAMRHMLEVVDGVAAELILAGAMLKEIGGFAALMDDGLDLDAQRLAHFAPIVLRCAQAGCPAAQEIVTQAVGKLAALVATLDCDAVPLYLNGGLADALKPGLALRVGRRIEEAAGDPMQGCFLVARGAAPIERLMFP